MPTAGDGFRITRSDSSERRGCVAKDDAVLGPFRNALVVYVVGHGVNDIAAALTSRDLDALLLPPLIINQSPWEAGLFLFDGSDRWMGLRHCLSKYSGTD